MADGLVVGTRDDQPEQTPGQFPTGMALNDFGGNYVVIKIGDGLYAYYAHLQKGSEGVRVQPGEWVRQGQVLCTFHTRGVVTNYDEFLGGAKAQVSPEQSGEQRNRLPLHATVNDFR